MSHYGVIVTVEPAEEPVTLDEAKLHCRIDGTDEDSIVTALIIAARQQIEIDARRALITQTRRLILDELDRCDTVRLPGGMVQSVSEIVYVDTAGVEQTVPAADYQVSLQGIPARVSPSRSALVWPCSDYLTKEAWRFDYVCGYGAASAVPSALKQALLLLVGHWYDNRQAAGVTAIHEVPMAYDALVSAYALPEFGLDEEPAS